MKLFPTDNYSENVHLIMQIFEHVSNQIYTNLTWRWIY